MIADVTVSADGQWLIVAAGEIGLGGEATLWNTADWTRGPRGRVFVGVMAQNAGVGFRCARSTAPRLSPEDFGGVTERQAAREATK